MRLQEGLVLYKSFNTLCFEPLFVKPPCKICVSVFLFPLFGIMTTDDVCRTYLKALFIIFSITKYRLANLFSTFLPDFKSTTYIQHCFICRSSDSTVSKDAGIEPRTVATWGHWRSDAKKIQIKNGQIFLI